MELDPTRDEERFIITADNGQTVRPSSASEPTIIDPSEHNIVFTSLVTSDKDIVGLVAYSIYKQNKYDWLMAFSRMQGRMPNEAEAQSYLMGESTARRLATYRHLAEATLEGRGLEVPGAGARSAMSQRAFPITSRPDTVDALSGFQPSRPLLVGIIAVILIALALIWMLHTGSPPPGKP